MLPVILDPCLVVFPPSKLHDLHYSQSLVHNSNQCSLLIECDFTGIHSKKQSVQQLGEIRVKTKEEEFLFLHYLCIFFFHFF